MNYEILFPQVSVILVSPTGDISTAFSLQNSLQLMFFEKKKISMLLFEHKSWYVK